MGKLNLQIKAISYKDVTESNNPEIRVFDLAYKKLAQEVSRPKSEDFLIPPGATQTIFDGTRTTAIDGTTAFDVTRPDA